MPKQARRKKTRSPSKSPTLVPKHLRELFEKAARARTHSYSPYSAYAVGAAVRLKNGRIYSGCNVENSTYGATTCAEQIAIYKAVSEEGKIEIADVLVITESDPPASPCGICRQVIAEFGLGAEVHCFNPEGKVRSHKLSDLLPDAFTPAHLDVRE